MHYPRRPLNLTLGFDLDTFQIPLEELSPSKKGSGRRDDAAQVQADRVLDSRNWPNRALSFIKPGPDAAEFLLLDGNLRVLALKDLG